MSKSLLSFIRDACPWYRSHIKGGDVGVLTQNQLTWLSGLPQTDKLVMAQFPIYCVVKAKEGVDLEVPFSMTLGVVAGYKDGYVVVRKNPTSDEKRFVHPSKLDRVAHWRGVTGKKLSRQLEWHKCRTKKGNP